MSTPVHLVAGFLGTGKTTALVRELARRKGTERCAIVVNDFGEARVDATLLDGAVGLRSIEGGCVCCTAPAGLAPAIAALLDEVRPDRIFLEPSGLARPRDVLDMLGRGNLRDRVRLMPTVVLVDAARVGDEPALVAEQRETADFVVLSRADLATAEQLAAARAVVDATWPAPLGVFEARHGELPAEVWDWPEGHGARATGFFRALPPSTAGYRAGSWIFPVDQVFSWQAVRDAVVRAPGVVRFKGLFHTDLGWFRLDVAGGRLIPGLSAYRSDSRCDLIVDDRGDLAAFEAALRAAVDPQANAPYEGEPVITVMGADRNDFTLTRGALRALPAQVPDVSTLHPGKKGAGVALASVLSLAPGTRYVVAAADGMTTRPAPVADVGSAVLVHSLDGRPLPAEQGGPFRLYVPAESACANVKGVARLTLLDAAED